MKNRHRVSQVVGKLICSRRLAVNYGCLRRHDVLANVAKLPEFGASVRLGRCEQSSVPRKQDVIDLRDLLSRMTVSIIVGTVLLANVR